MGWVGLREMILMELDGRNWLEGGRGLVGAELAVGVVTRCCTG